MIWMFTAKALGAACLLMLGGAVGTMRARRLKSRQELLEQMAVCLSSLGEMLSRNPGATDEMLRRAAQVAGMALPLACDASPLPQRLKTCFARQSAQQTEVSKTEWSLFFDAVTALCTEDTLSVCRRLDYARQRLEQLGEEARECARVQGKLYQRMGIAAGAAAALVLM